MKKIWLDKVEFREIEADAPIRRLVSIDGKVISLRRGGKPVLVGTHLDPDGYVRICRPNIKIHHAVLLAWGYPRPNGAECRHLDGVKTNNHVSNLTWGTQKENGLDKRAHGNAKGVKNHRAKLTESDVVELRRLYKDMPLSEVRKRYPQFSQFCIWSACSGYTWTHLPGAIPKNRKCEKNAWREGVKVR